MLLREKTGEGRKGPGTARHAGEDAFVIGKGAQKKMAEARERIGELRAWAPGRPLDAWLGGLADKALGEISGLLREALEKGAPVKDVAALKIEASAAYADACIRCMEAVAAEGVDLLTLGDYRVAVDRNVLAIEGISPTKQYPGESEYRPVEKAQGKIFDLYRAWGLCLVNTYLDHERKVQSGRPFSDSEAYCQATDAFNSALARADYMERTQETLDKKDKLMGEISLIMSGNWPYLKKEKK
jgi:hypothetical protein